MIGCCPLDNDFGAPPKVYKRPVAPKKNKTIINGDDTECNYLVMFFVLGVFALAISDQLKR